MKNLVAYLMCAVLMASTAGCDSTRADALREVRQAVAVSGIDRQAAAAITGKIDKSPDRFLELLAKARAEMDADPFLLRRVDKIKSLPDSYEPKDLVSLDGKNIPVSRTGHRLREGAFRALAEMTAAAGREGLTLLVSSSYRSFGYQKEVFARNVAEMGQKEAARVSAAPGSSQHQLGTAVDFGSISDSFALTKAGIWVAEHAGAYGFSLSYPKGLEAETGYVWESWHFRYIGKSAVALQNEFFGGIQHRLIVFLDVLGQGQAR